MDIAKDLKENINPNEIQRTQIKSKIELFETQIKTYSGSDPFSLWFNYITYLKKLSVNDLKECGIKIYYVFQRCIAKCQPFNYHSDERFIRIFMEYNKNYEKTPLNKFEWMYNHKYGIKMVDFYLEWASLYENKYLREESIRIIELGFKNIGKHHQLEQALKRLKPNKCTECNEKFGFNSKQLYPNFPNLNEELSLEEIRGQIYYKISEQLQAKFRKEKKQYVDEINELKNKLEIFNKTKQDTQNTLLSKRNKSQDSILFTRLGELTNVTLGNQTSIWKDKNDENDFEEDEEEDDFENRVKFDTEDKPFERTMPPPPPPQSNELSSLNETNILMTISVPNATISIPANNSNDSISCRMLEDKNNLSRMFHLSRADLTTNITTSPNIISEPKTTENVCETKSSQKYNEDGSLFFYESNSLTINNIANRPIELNINDTTASNLNPACLKSNESHIETLKFNEKSRISFETSKSINNSIEFSNKKLTCDGNESKLEDFEPPVSSTCFLKSLKPIIKRENAKSIEEKIEEENEEKLDLDLEKEKLLNLLIQNDHSKEEKENNMSKLISEDCITQATKWSNCISKFKNKQSVKFMSPVNSYDKISQVANEQKTLIGLEIEWDSEPNTYGGTSALNINDQNDTVNAINFSLIKSNFKITEYKEKNDNLYDFESDNGKLTSEMLNETFNADYLRLYYNNSAVNTPINGQITFNKIVEEQIKSFNVNESMQQFLTERTMVSLPHVAELTQSTIVTNNIENETDPDISKITKLEFQPTVVVKANEDLQEQSQSLVLDSVELSNHSLTENITILNETTVNTTNMNETIIQAIRDPFSFDIKTRLLERGPINKLKANLSYKALCTIAPVIRKKMSVQLNDNETYNIVEEIGKGAYAQIYLIQSKNNKEKKYALKVDKQATAWEFYITETIHERLKEMIKQNQMLIDVSNSIIKIEQFMKFNTGCFSAMTYYKNGSLLDLINYHVERNKLEFPYWFVIYLTLEMLNILDYLHKCKILHADIKVDNFLIDKIPDSIHYFAPNQTKCLVLIDFNRSIDLSMLPSEAKFDAKTENKSLLCCEMKSNKSWTYQIDFYGILSSIHCIIFRKYIEVYTESNRFRITKKMPRFYDQIFNDLFDTYLNIPSCQEIPNLEKDWICKFVNLFKQELSISFHKSSDYLKALNIYYANKN